LLKRSGQANVLAANVESSNVRLHCRLRNYIHHLELEKQVLVLRKQIDETSTNIAGLELRTNRFLTFQLQ